MENVIFVRWDERPVRALIQAGVKPALVLESADLVYDNPDPALLKACATVYEVSSTDSTDEMSAVAVDLLQRGLRRAEVVCSHEQAVYGCGVLAQVLGDRADALVRAARVRDKRLMKAAVAAVGVPTAAFASVHDPADAAQVQAAVDRVPFPMVVKPVNGMATIATVRVNDRAALDAVLRSVDFGPSGIRSRHLTLEEFVEGEEFHVDAVWRGGKPWVFAVSRYFCPRIAIGSDKARRPVEAMNGSFLLPEDEHGELYAAIRSMHRDVNRALGIERGITHLEFFRRDGEIVFSEIANRVGGGGADLIVSQGFGQSLHDIWATELAGGSREDLDWREGGGTRHVGWFNAAPTESGVIERMPNPADILAIEGVTEVELLREQGTRITLAHPSVWCVFVGLEASTEGALLDLAERVSGGIDIPVVA